MLHVQWGKPLLGDPLMALQLFLRQGLFSHELPSTGRVTSLCDHDMASSKYTNILCMYYYYWNNVHVPTYRYTVVWQVLMYCS